MENLLRISPADNVAVALKNLSKGDEVKIGGGAFALVCDVPFGHKVALCDIPAGGDVVKYAHRIGRAKTDIPRGGKVDETNLKTALGGLDEYEYRPAVPAPQPPQSAFFNGYVRASGEAGVRNELWIVPLVSCVNCLARSAAEKFARPVSENFDGAFAICHSYGCSQLGCDHANTRAILADLCMNPNAGGVLVLSLGCENNKLSEFKTELENRGADFSRIRFLEAQKSDDEMSDALAILEELADAMSADRRVKTPLSKLKIGLKCGGSDAFSGITANALIGKFSDRAVACGASCALCEVPEMFGAESLLMNRAESVQVFEKFVAMINDFKNYFISNKMPVYENPSPGNKAGGISTLEEKSLGCVQKGGTSAVRDVLRYAQRISKTGLTLLESPGNDPVAATALAAAGCQIVLFSTGRGTPFAAAVPTIKISSNTPLFEKKNNWIDFNAGSILDGKNLDVLCGEFFDFVLSVASGAKTKAELNGYKEIAIFKTGVTL